MNKNECSIAATGPPIFEGLRENPKSLSSSKAEKFEFLFLHSVLSGGGEGSATTWDHWGDPGGGPRENPRSLSSPNAEKFEKKICTVCSWGGGGPPPPGFIGGIKGEVHAKTPGLYQVPKMAVP